MGDDGSWFEVPVFRSSSGTARGDAPFTSSPMGGQPCDVFGRADGEDIFPAEILETSEYIRIISTLKMFNQDQPTPQLTCHPFSPIKTVLPPIRLGQVTESPVEWPLATAPCSDSMFFPMPSASSSR